MKSRLMYIEYKGDGLSGPARIGRVSFSKRGKTIYYAGKTFQSLKGTGFKANYFDIDESSCFSARVDHLLVPRPFARHQGTSALTLEG